MIQQKASQTRKKSVKTKVSNGVVNREALLASYRALLKARLIEERMLRERKTGGELSKWFSSYGQEAISVGCALAMQPDEYILTMHRDLGAFAARGVPLDKLFAQFLGKMEGFTKGRDRSFHFGTHEYHLVGMISHLGPQMTVANGIALASKMKQEKKASLVFTGEGGTSQGDFHEALNIASVWELPVIFIIENNHWALSTPVSQQYRCERLSERAKGYGMEGITIDGNDLLLVQETVECCASEIRENPRPILIECMTYRLHGHELGSQDPASAEFLQEGRSKDPVAQLERHLLEQAIITKTEMEQFRQELEQEIETALEIAKALPPAAADAEREIAEVYALSKPPIQLSSAASTKKRFVDGILDALEQAMEADPNLILMGQDIEFGGVFKTTQGLIDKFGAERVRNTPLCESGILGAAAGLAIKGIPSIVEMQFGDFATSGFTQIANYLPKLHWRWEQSAPVVIRMPVGAGVGAGPFHSQTNEALYAHIAGLKVVYPSTPYDAKGLLIEAIRDPNPVIFMEHKALYRERSIEQEIPDAPYSVEIGKARVAREGKDIAIITYGLGVLWAETLLNQHSEIDAYILDLRTLVPLDIEAIGRAVKATNKALILHEAPRANGFGGHIVSVIDEHFWEYLDAPPRICASLDTPVPFSKELEKNYLARSRFEQMLLEMVAY